MTQCFLAVNFFFLKTSSSLRVEVKRGNEADPYLGILRDLPAEVIKHDGLHLLKWFAWSLTVRLAWRFFRDAMWASVLLLSFSSSSSQQENCSWCSRTSRRLSLPDTSAALLLHYYQSSLSHLFISYYDIWMSANLWVFERVSVWFTEQFWRPREGLRDRGEAERIGSGWLCCALVLCHLCSLYQTFRNKEEILRSHLLTRGSAHFLSLLYMRSTSCFISSWKLRRVMLKHVEGAWQVFRTEPLQTLPWSLKNMVLD